MSEIWFVDLDPFTKAHGMGFKIKRQLFSIQSPYQKIDVFETYDFGKMLVLDGIIQLSEKDEFIYHEMLAHVAMHAHPDPKNILIIGGGDGCCLREVIKHDIESVTLVDIDKTVVEVCKQYLGLDKGSFEHRKARVVIEDGAKFVGEHNNVFDVIICDATDAPCEASRVLLTEEFYHQCYKALSEDGIFVTQGGAPIFKWNIIEETYSRIAKAFKIAEIYSAFIPSFAACWPFIIASKYHDVRKGKKVEISTKYYSAARHKLAFDMAEFLAYGALPAPD